MSMALGLGSRGTSREQGKSEDKCRNNYLRSTTGLNPFVGSALIYYSDASQYFQCHITSQPIINIPRPEKDAVCLNDLGGPVFLPSTLSPAFRGSVLSKSLALSSLSSQLSIAILPFSTDSFPHTEARSQRPYPVCYLASLYLHFYDFRFFFYSLGWVY